MTSVAFGIIRGTDGKRRKRFRKTSGASGNYLSSGCTYFRENMVIPYRSLCVRHRRWRKAVVEPELYSEKMNCHRIGRVKRGVRPKERGVERPQSERNGQMNRQIPKMKWSAVEVRVYGFCMDFAAEGPFIPLRRFV